MGQEKYFQRDEVTGVWSESPGSGAVVRFGFDGGRSLEGSAQETGIPLAVLQQAFFGGGAATAVQAAPLPSVPRKRRKQRDAGDVETAAAVAAVADAGDGGD